MELMEEIVSIVRKRVHEDIRLTYEPCGLLISEGQALRLKSSFDFSTAAMIAVGIKPSSIEEYDRTNEGYGIEFLLTSGACGRSAYSREFTNTIKKKLSEGQDEDASQETYEFVMDKVQDTINTEIETTLNNVRAALQSACASYEISRDELKAFLDSVGMYCEFFAKEEQKKAAYLDEEHPHYSLELKAAVTTWEALAENPALQKSNETPKQSITRFLEENYPNLSGKGKDRVATVVNWKPEGGAVKTI